MKTPALWAVALLLSAQDPDIAEDYRRLQARLYTPETGTTERMQRLRAFLERHGDAASDRRVLAARTQLAGTLLERLQASAARTQFTVVREIATPDEHDLHGRALYGIAQAQELEGNADGARATLRQLLRDHEGTRYARFARVALARLSSSRELAPGKPIPELRLGKDLQGRTLRRDDLRGTPFLLVFFDPEHDPSRTRLEALWRVWRQAGHPDEHVIAYAVGSSEAALRAAADRHGWTFPILAADEGFLHQDLLALGVSGVPSSCLVGSDGRLLARDLPPDRLAQALARGRGG